MSSGNKMAKQVTGGNIFLFFVKNEKTLKPFIYILFNIKYNIYIRENNSVLPMLPMLPPKYTIYYRKNKTHIVRK